MWPFELWLSPDICSGVASFKTSCFIVSLKSKQLCQFYPKHLIVIFTYWHLTLDKDIFFNNLITDSQLLSIIYALNFRDVFKMHIDISKISSFLAPWLEKLMATYSSPLPGKSHGWRSLVGCSPWGCEELDRNEWLHFHFSLFTFMHWRRKWQSTPVFLPGESQGPRSLVDLAAAAVAAPWWWRK